MQGHAQHDDARYVPKALVEKWAARDPIARFRRLLSDSAVSSEKELDEIDAMTKSYAGEEAQLAEGSPMPDPATVTRGVYAGDDFATPRVELVKSPFATS
jgi:TPP-dependent pyruvate/acetoin dehydrogenase alpha subunit